jgi:hypothetical protein
VKAPTASARSNSRSGSFRSAPLCGSGLSTPPREEDRAAEGEDHSVNGGSLQSLAARLGEVTSLAVVYPAVASSSRMALLRAARVSVDQAVVVVPQIAELCSTMAGRGASSVRGFGRCFGSDITSFAGAGHPLRRECSLFIWSGQVDLIPLQQALAGLLLTGAAVIIALRLTREAS